jgi:hypothetical protein
MNERIKQLAEQATTIVDMVGPQGYTSSYANFDREKFAELIVKECILTIQMGITRDGPDTEKYLRSMKHIRQIEEHFGVK